MAIPPTEGRLIHEATPLGIPGDIVFIIFSHLSVKTILRLARVARSWNEFISVNRETISYNILVANGFVPFAEQTAADAARASGIKADSWFTFCKTICEADRSWMGRGPSHCCPSYAKGEGVESFQVDEANGFLIAAKPGRFVKVYSLNDAETLWELQALDMGSWCNYSDGFLAYERFGFGIEVWCMVQHHDPPRNPSQSPPDDVQLTKWALSEASFSSSPIKFRPWAFLSFPTGNRAIKLRFPELLYIVGSQISIWNIETGLLSLSVPFLEIFDCLCVDFNMTHIVWFSSVGLEVVERGNYANRYVQDHLDDSPATEIELKYQDKEQPHNHPVIEPVHVVGQKYRDEYIRMTYVDALYAVSIYGSKPSLLLHSAGGLLLIPDFGRVLRGEDTFQDAATCIALPESLKSRPTWNNCFSPVSFNQNRIALLMRKSVIIITLNDEEVGVNELAPRVQANTETVFKSIVRHVYTSNPPRNPRLRRPCGLTLTPTNVYFIYECERGDGIDQAINRVCMTSSPAF